MKQRLQEYYQSIKRFWRAIKAVDYTLLGKYAAVILTAVPGVVAWLLEVSALAVSISFIFKTASLAYEDKLWQAIGLAALSGMMIILTLLSSHYTAPKNSKDGGGG